MESESVANEVAKSATANAWVELDGEAIRRNLATFRALIGTEVRLGAVIKSNAYGHGLLETARAIGEAADWFCVNALDEGLALRRAGERRPILVMGATPTARLAELVAADLRPVLYDRETLRALDRAADRELRVHLKAETGTYRQGANEAELLELVDALAGSEHLALDGLYTHFANIEDTTDHGFAREQLATYRRIAAAVGERHDGPLIRHTACSAATLLFPETHGELVRIGISLYGIWPSRETRVSCGKELQLVPALTWKTRIAQVKQIPEGAYVGYGCTYRTTRPTRLAVLPLGYFEGYDRRLSGAAHVLVRGKRAPVRGRVCMNMTLVDVTDVPAAAVDDEVVLIGAQGEERLSAEQLAGWCGTIPYEILSRIHEALPRRVIS